MSRTLSIARPKMLALVALALVALCVALVSAPKQAGAAVLTLTAATTTSNNASTTLAKTGDTVTFGIQLSGTPSATTTPRINIMNMGSTSFTGTGAFWSYSTTTASVWTEGDLSFHISWGGSLGEATTTVTQTGLTGANVRFDKTGPTVSTITATTTCTGSNDTCRVGDTIGFTATPGATELGGSVSGSYNSTALTWVTSNSGQTFVSQYTVAATHSNQSDPLQISGVVITDAAGNASSAGASTGVNVKISVSSGTPTTQVSSGGGGGGGYSMPADTPLPTQAAPAATTAVSPPVSSGLSTAQVNSILAVLTSFGADSATLSKVQAALTSAPTTGSSVSAAVRVFKANLTTGSLGEQVRALQQYLNSHGYPIATSGPGSPGNETAFFGAGTRAALTKFQQSKGLPATGFFGPMTRAAISGMQ